MSRTQYLSDKQSLTAIQNQLCAETRKRVVSLAGQL